MGFSNDNLKTKSHKTLNVFETFSGIGAQHRSLELVKKYLKKQNLNFDFKIVATSEWDIYANIAYDAIHNDCVDKYESIDIQDKVNFLKKFTHSTSGKAPVDNDNLFKKLDRKTIDLLYKSYKDSNNLGSIVEVNGSNLIESVADKRVDLITYSFPCQDLSVAGSIHGFNKGMEEGSETRSSLLWQIGRVLDELKELDKLPKFLLLENVKNMLSAKHMPQYKKWLTKLKELGYSTKTFVLDAKEFGLPQHRERVFAVSVLDYKYQIQDKVHGEIGDYFKETDLKKNIIPKLTLKDIIQENYHNPKLRWEAETVWANDTPSRRRMFEGNYVLNKYNKQYSRTLTTKQDRHPNAGVIDLSWALNQGLIRMDRLSANPYFETNIYRKKKSNFRFLTPRESYMLMGFRFEDFDKVISLKDSRERNIFKKEKLWQQAGNSIAINAITPVMNFIAEYWINEENRK